MRARLRIPSKKNVATGTKPAAESKVIRYGMSVGGGLPRLYRTGPFFSIVSR